jgi:hypothetical protein
MAEDITKLPKWARRRIEYAERELAHLQAEMRGQFPGTDTFRSPYMFKNDLDSDGIPLPKGETVRFKFGESWDSYIDCMIRDDDPTGPTLEVRGGYGLAVEPRSSNSIRVRGTR